MPSGSGASRSAKAETGPTASSSSSRARNRSKSEQLEEVGMANTRQAARIGPYAQELLENAYVQENLSDGVEKLRAAYRRARKRRVEPTRDERLHEQLRSATRSLTEAGQALRSGRRKPKPRWGRRAMVVGR